MPWRLGCFDEMMACERLVDRGRMLKGDEKYSAVGRQRYVLKEASGTSAASYRGQGCLWGSPRQPFQGYVCCIATLKKNTWSFFMSSKTHWKADNDTF